jgi:hypothetical protein
VTRLSVEERWRHVARVKLRGIVEQLYSSMVKVKAGAKVITIEPAQNALAMEQVVKLFTAF